MKKNVGSIDKTIRSVIAIIMVALVSTRMVTGMVSYILLGLAIVLALTSFVSFCPIYYMLGLKSTPKEKGKK